MGRETDSWPLVLAKYYKKVAVRKVRVVVWHDMEYAETLKAAEDVANYFHNMSDGRIASAHICVDADSIVQCVPDRYIAYAAPGCNTDGIQIECAGVARQTRAEWLDEYGIKLLDRASNACAQYLVKFDLPPVKLSDDELQAGKKGYVGHDQVSRVYKQSSHTDPGPNFPWDYVYEKVCNFYIARINLRPLV